MPMLTMHLVLHLAMCLFFLVPLSYAACVNFVPAYRNVADSFSHTKVGIDVAPKDEEAGSGSDKDAAPKEIKEVGEPEGRRKPNMIDTSNLYIAVWEKRFLFGAEGRGGPRNLSLGD